MQAIRRGVLGTLALSLLLSAPVQAQLPSSQTVTVTADKAPIPVGDFFRHSKFGTAALSPDATHVAVTIAGDDGILMLAVVPLDTMQPKILVKTVSDVASVRWINDRRMVFTFSDRAIGQADQRMGPGVFAVDLDGKNLVEVATRSIYLASDGRIKKSLPPSTYLLDSLGNQDSNKIYVEVVSRNGDKESMVDLVGIDTLTMEQLKLGRPGRTVDWLLDANGEPRIAMTNEGPNAAAHYLDPATGKWSLLFQQDEQSAELMTPVAMDAGGKLLVITRNGKDKSALYRYDIAARKLEAEPVLALEDYDFTGNAVVREKKVIGVHYESDAPGTVWFDPRAAAIQKEVDALLPRTANRLSFARSTAMRHVLVSATSDIEPGATLVYDTSTKKLIPLGRRMPHIDPQRMAEKEPVRYKARDGLTIPGYLTLPRGGAKNLPMIVMVHGGPWVRGGHWSFDGVAQFLASRGYAVLEPEFRGSTGFGAKHFFAGFRQWGLAMQDDVADGARWAIAQGIADPKRICIAGASYGGYATLMGLINDPDLFRCGVDWVGVTDPNLLFDVHWSDVSESGRKYSYGRMVGDQKKDAEQFRATSPIVQAARLKRPVMLAYGGDDQRVPLIHGTKFRDAVMEHNKDVEWIVYPEEGHGWRLEKNNVDFWSRVEKFLDRNIGPGAAK